MSKTEKQFDPYTNRIPVELLTDDELEALNKAGKQCGFEFFNSERWITSAVNQLLFASQNTYRAKRGKSIEVGPSWGEMSDSEKGALLLAEHEGKVIEYYIDADWYKCYLGCGSYPTKAYRVRPVVESLWYNLYPKTIADPHKSRELADCWATDQRTGVLRTDITDGTVSYHLEGV